METSQDSHSLDRFDTWIISSLLQKSIRRSDTATAQRAASTFHRRKGPDIFRRLMIVAVEDVGLGDIGLVQEAARLSDRKYRRDIADDPTVLLRFVRQLSEAPKDRSSDYLCSARVHPDFGSLLMELEGAPQERLLDLLSDPSQQITCRGLAALVACRTGYNGRIWARGQHREVLAALNEAGAPEELTSAARIIAERTTNAMPIMLPLLWLAAGREGTWGERAGPLPAEALYEGLPLYALDKHTRTGRQAIRLLARRYRPLTAILANYAPKRARDAAYMAAFYADATPTARRRTWPGSDELEVMGTEADMVWAGVAREGVSEVLAGMREALPMLNEFRREVLAETLAPPRQRDLYARPEGGSSHE